MKFKKKVGLAKLKLKKIFSYRWVQVASAALLFGGVGYFILTLTNAASPGAPAAPTVYISPITQTIAKNTTFTIEVREDSGTTAINAVQANFTYPTNMLTYVSTNTTNSAFSIEAENTVNTTTGQVNLGRGASGGTSLTGDKLIATMTFTTKTVVGTANLTFGTGTVLVDATTNVDILPGPSALGHGVYIVDTDAPTVSVTAPAGNIEYGSTYNITATAASPDSSVTKVEFFVDGTLKGQDTTSPYTYAWATTGVTEGTRALTAKVYDAAGKVTVSSAVNATVIDSIAPTVSITSPVANANLSGTITVSVTANDNTNGKGLAKTELYVDNVLKSTDTTSPYQFVLDSTTLTAGAHTLSAKAYDNALAANITTSSNVAVTVDNSDKTAPSAPTSLRATNTTLTSITLAWNASTDNVGVTAYRLSRGATVIYTGPALTFVDSGLTEASSYNYSIVALDAANNVSTAATLTSTTNTRKRGDVTGDNIINMLDISLIISPSKWRTSDALCDLNSDNTVNMLDVSVVLTNWGK